MDVLCLFIDLCTKAVYMLKGHGKNFTTIQPDAGCLQRDHGLVLEEISHPGSRVMMNSDLWVEKDLFTRSDELEAAWQFVTPVLDYWEKEKVVPEPYAAGTWGPAAADRLLKKRTCHPAAL